jgi:poly-gamma-glutamate synthesis protein (capsule biosynthesis protein)
MISIGFTGDFCPWRRVEEAYLSGNWKHMFETVQPFLTANDLNVLDLECPLTVGEDQIKKTGPHIKALPETAEILNYLKCKVVATANNHFKDYAAAGMQETYYALKNNNIDWLGSGNSFEEASRIYYWEKDNLKFAFINVAENEWTTTYEEDSAGCHPIDLVNVFNHIQEAKKTADFIIVITHGGHEHYELPSPRMKKWYRFFVDAGANAIIGHHTHIISGYEVYKGSPIFYSLGNFCFDWEGLQNKPWNKGMMVRLQFEKNKPIQFDLSFFNQNNENAGVYLMNEEERKLTRAHVEKLNEIIEDDLQLNKSFKDYSKTWKPLMNTWLQPYKGKYMPSLHKRGWLPSLISEEKKMLYTNLIRCEAHRDILLNTINPTQK